MHPGKHRCLVAADDSYGSVVAASILGDHAEQHLPSPQIERALFHIEGSQLEARLKHLALSYDQIVLQDGCFSSTVWADGQSYSTMVPPAACGFDRLASSTPEPGDQPSLVIEAGQTRVAIGSGPAELNATVDFLPVVHRAGLANVDFVILEDGDLANVHVDQLEKRANDVRSSCQQELTDAAGLSSRHLLKSLLEHLFVDLGIGEAKGVALSLDGQATGLLRWGMQSLFQPWRDSPRGVFHARLIELGFPDVSNEPWDRVMEIRESAAGRDFRAMLDRVVTEASCGLVDGNDPVDVQRTVERALNDEVMDELVGRSRGTVQGTVIDVALNFVALGPLIGGLVNLREVVSERRSWVSLVRRRAV